MKILRITLRNLASLAGQHTVDFTREPLRSAGLFSIGGPTGSGKSTLLDALCLALYEETPRLCGIGRLAELDDGQRQNDPRNLLRRGTGEGVAEVVFVGVDHQIYTARWVVRRAHGKADGAFRNTEMTLFRGNVLAPANGETVCGGKKTEVLAAIAERIGLSFEQFTRAVLLAQNDFATFLKADDKARAEILQALTGTERFEEISRAVYDREVEEKRAVAEIEAQIAGQAPLSAEARDAAEAACAEAGKQWKEAAERLAARAAHALWFVRLAELSAAVKRVEKSWQEAVAARAAAAPRRIELEHTAEAASAARSLRDAERRTHDDTGLAAKAGEQATAAQSTAQTDLVTRKEQRERAEKIFVAAKSAADTAEPLLRQARELDARLGPVTERLGSLVHERANAEKHWQAAGEKRKQLLAKTEAAKAERAAVESKREKLAHLGEFAPHATAWVDRLDRAMQIRHELDEARRAAARGIQDEEEKKRRALAERAREPELRAAFGAAETALEAAEKAAGQYDGERLARARKEAEEIREALCELDIAVREAGELTRQEAAVQAELRKLREADVADVARQAELKAQQWPAAEAAVVAARAACELAEAAIADETTRLREKLQPEAPCPVCGSREHPYAAHPPVAEAVVVRALREDLARKETAFGTLRMKVAELEAAVRQRAVQQDEKQKALEAFAPRLAAARALCPAHPAAQAIVALPENERPLALERDLGAMKETLQKLESEEDGRRAAEKQRDFCRTAQMQAKQACEILERSLATLAPELTCAQAVRESADAVVQKLATAQQTAHAELAPLIAGPTAAAVWEHDPASFRARFSEEASTFLALEKRGRELETSLGETHAELAPVGEQFTTAEATLATRRSEEATAAAACAALREQRAALLAGRPADEVERELREKLQQANEARDRSEQEVIAADKRLASRAEAATAAQRGLAAARERWETAGAALTKWLGDFGTRTGWVWDRAALETLLARDETWVRAERAALDALEAAVRNAEGALAVHRQTCDAHLAQRPTPEEETAVAADLPPLRGAVATAEQSRDAARAVLVADDQRRVASVELTRALEARRTAAEPWQKLNELIGSADGAKFRGIAQRRTLDLLLGYANAQLEQLAARYRLERLPESLNLIVLDRDMGDERRSVHSLSGGESFLVSLALALALASLTSNRLRIESLFIDEGFGSLDAETLNTAMNALMHLEAQGRKVGVISHVSEMADAIPVQIRVVKGRGGASRLVVPGAPAENPDSEESAQPGGANDRSADMVAAQILEILEREHAEGRAKVSSRALRGAIGCEPATFKTALGRLAGKIIAEDRSVMLSAAVRD